MIARKINLFTDYTMVTVSVVFNVIMPPNRFIYFALSLL